MPLIRNVRRISWSRKSQRQYYYHLFFIIRPLTNSPGLAGPWWGLQVDLSYHIRPRAMETESHWRKRHQGNHPILRQSDPESKTNTRCDPRTEEKTFWLSVRPNRSVTPTAGKISRTPIGSGQCVEDSSVKLVYLVWFPYWWDAR